VSEHIQKKLYLLKEIGESTGRQYVGYMLGHSSLNYGGELTV